MMRQQDQRTYEAHGQYLVLTHLPNTRPDARNYEVEHTNARGITRLTYHRHYLSARLAIRRILRDASHRTDHPAPNVAFRVSRP